jgi:nucleotide-binding universal stress UspA family protein
MPFAIRTILAPVDFGTSAEHSLDVALDLAKSVGASVHVVHVYQIPVYGFPDGAFLAGPEIATRMSEAAQKGLDAVLERAGKSGIRVTGSLRQGAAHDEIVAAAKELSADLVVIGTHGRRGLSHALMGSVAEKVVRISPIPVLTVRAPEA